MVIFSKALYIWVSHGFVHSLQKKVLKSVFTEAVNSKKTIFGPLKIQVGKFGWTIVLSYSIYICTQCTRTIMWNFLTWNQFFRIVQNWTIQKFCTIRTYYIKYGFLHIKLLLLTNNLSLFFDVNLSLFFAFSTQNMFKFK